MTRMDDLRNTIADLSTTISDLRVTAAELKTVVTMSTARAIEDRVTSTAVEVRVSAIERWRSRIQGQIALVYFLVGILATLIGAGIAHLIP